MALCCKPVHGDDIVGYITRGNGITIHRSTCRNLASMDDRCIKVSWDEKPTNKYCSDLLIRTNTLDDKLFDIISAVVKINASVTSIKTIKDEYVTYEMEVIVKEKEHLDKLILDLSNLPYITSVERLIS